jgi:hypothetical protein
LAEAVPASFADAVPDFSADAVPAFSADVVPAFSVDVVPASSADVIPASSADVIPASSADVIPASSADVIPASSADVVPASSADAVQVHPQGSSRATGGILRGHAAASYYSPADEENTMFNTIGTPAKLTAKIYTSNLDPLNLNHGNMVPSSKVTIKMYPNLGSILDNISKRYPAIKGI